MEKKRNNKLIPIIIILILCFIGWRLFRSSNKSPLVENTTQTNIDKVLVDCTMTKDSVPEKVEGWVTWMYPAIVASPMPYPENKTELQDSYSASGITNRTEKGNIYYRIEMDPRADLPRDTRKIIEVCDENNQTVQFGSTRDTKVQGASENVKASTSIISPFSVSGKSSTYRIDGLLYTQGKWTLTDRINSVKITN